MSAAADTVVGDALRDYTGALLTKDDEQRFTDADRGLMKIHFRALTERIRILEEAAADTGNTASGVRDKFAKELSDHEDIFEYLRAEIHKKNSEVNDLREEQQRMQEEREEVEQEHEKALQAMQDNAVEEKALLQQEVDSVKAELKRIENFIKKEAELEAELSEKKRMLEEESKGHATSISDLERKHVQEKDRLKKEMLFKLRETKANLLKMTDNQLDTTTKRTIAENEQMSSELAWQSKETEKLIRKNDKLVGENQALKRELSLHKQTQEEFARKQNVYQKTIKTLLAKLNALDTSQQAELQRIHLEEDEKEREKAEVLCEREQLEESLSEAQMRLGGMHEDNVRLQNRLHDVETMHANVLSLQDEAVKFTLQCLTDMRTRKPNPMPAGMDASDPYPPSDGGEGPSLQTLDPNEREAVIRYLLDQLRAYQHQLKELELHNAWKQHTAAATGDGSLPPILQNGSAVAGSGWAAPQPPPLGQDLAPMGGDEETTYIALGSNPLRPWGKRSASKGPTRDAFGRR